MSELQARTPESVTTDVVGLGPDAASLQVAREVMAIVTRSYPELMPYHTRVRREREIALLLRERCTQLLASLPQPDPETSPRAR